MVKAYFFQFLINFLKIFFKFPNNRCNVGQQPTLCFQLKNNAQKDCNGHFYTKIVTNLYFFYNGTIFLTNLANFGHVSAPTKGGFIVPVLNVRVFR